MKHGALLLLVLFFTFPAFAQEYGWKVGLDYFFDNREYKKSSFAESATLNGIWLTPLGSIGWGERHSLLSGVNLLKIPGMGKAVDKVDVTMYYQYKSPALLFRVGSFPRSEVLGNYNNFFFKDSVNNYLPLMQGVFWQIGSDRKFFNAWFDRTGYPTSTRREHFFLGMSGRLSRGLFFADFQSYLFHYANSNPAVTGEGVSENFQLQAMAGVEYEGSNGLSGLVAAGTLVGYERDRRFEGARFKPAGFVARGDAEIWGIGTSNTLYWGDPRMRLASTFGGNLYWGTAFLRAGSYVESEWYIRLIESERVQARFSCNLHFTESKLLFQQMFTVSASVGSLTTGRRAKTGYPWTTIFH